MPTSLTSFDLTFDNTFTGLLPYVPVIAVDACQLAGINLCWVSACGWCNYVFTGNSDLDVLPKSLGTFEQGGLDRDSQLKSQYVKTIRAGHLTQSDALIVCSVFESNERFVFLPNSLGNMILVPVRVEPSTFGVWRDSQGRMSVEAKLFLPKRKSQRS